MLRRVSDIMRQNPICLQTNAPLKDVIHLMTQGGLSHLPVLEGKTVVGIVSKSDLIRQFIKILDLSSGKHYTELMMEHILISDIMVSDPVCVDMSDDVTYAAELLLQGQFHVLPVINSARDIQGIVTSYDILESLYTSSKN